jgi:hypothetical protein
MFSRGPNFRREGGFPRKFDPGGKFGGGGEFVGGKFPGTPAPSRLFSDVCRY